MTWKQRTDCKDNKYYAKTPILLARHWCVLHPVGSIWLESLVAAVRDCDCETFEELRRDAQALKMGYLRTEIHTLLEYECLLEAETGSGFICMLGKKSVALQQAISCLCSGWPDMCVCPNTLDTAVQKQKKQNTRRDHWNNLATTCSTLGNWLPVFPKSPDTAVGKTKNYSFDN